MKRFTMAFLSLLVATVVARAQDENLDRMFDLNFKPVNTSAHRIREHGYPAESHFVETFDGYVLNIFRIPYSPRLNNANESKPVVLIQHGLFSCSDCFLLNGPDNALAYNFADKGYDVWLGNARGNIYCRNNTKISVKHSYFWSFSWHEIGHIDVPTMIDYILEKTGATGLHYAGHSQGSTVFFVMTTTRPEYNAKIKTAHMMAPPIFMGNSSSGMLKALTPVFGVPGIAAALLENQQFVPQNPLLQRIFDKACSGKPKLPLYCKTLFLLWAGGDNDNLNKTLLPQIAETHPAGISINQGIHFVQEHVSQKFRQYDHGHAKNWKLYAQVEPPEYPLDRITADLYIYYSLADQSAAAEDVERLPDYLSTIKYFGLVEDPNWSHIDFIFATKVKQTINDKIIQFCESYEGANPS